MRSGRKAEMSWIDCGSTAGKRRRDLRLTRSTKNVVQTGAFGVRCEQQETAKVRRKQVPESGTLNSRWLRPWKYQNGSSGLVRYWKEPQPEAETTG